MLRTALALSLVTGRRLRIARIRAGRRKPGLLRQHLTSVRAAAEVGTAQVSGDDLGSLNLSFEPSRVLGGDYRWSVGQVQIAQRGARRIPVHGGLGDAEGIANFINYAPNTTTLEPDPPLQPLVEGSRYLRRDGYPVNRGSSFVMVVGFTDAGPRARAVLSYGQSGDPASPHFSDQTELFSQKRARPILFTNDEITADKALRTQTVTGARRTP